MWAWNILQTDSVSTSSVWNRWYQLRYCDNLWYQLRYCDNLWYQLRYCDNLWYQLRYCDNLWVYSTVEGHLLW